MERFYKGQCEILEHIAEGRALPEVLAEIVRLIESTSSMACSILLLDSDGKRVRHGAAPSLPADYVKLLDGAPIGPEEGSCGAAAYHRRKVVIEDIATHPNWRVYRAAALPHGLRACWSSPVFDTGGQVLGTFAMYYRETRGPTDQEAALVETATHLAAVAIGNARKQAAEAALRASEERLRAVVGNTPNVSIQWYDEDGRIIFCNDASVRMFGWTGIDVIGKRLVDLGFFGAAEEEKFGELRRLAAVGTVPPVEFEFRRPDGATGYLLSTVFQIPFGESSCYVCMDVDLTERRRMEEAVRAGEALRASIYASVIDPIFCVAVEGGDRYRFLSVNPAFARGVARSESDIVGREVGEVVPPVSCERLRAKYREAIAHRREVSWESFGEYPHGVRHGVVTVCPIFDDEDRCIIVGTTHDITEMRQAEAERRALEAQLQRNQRLQSLGTLASGIAHDFNNILAAITANASLALEEDAPLGEVRDSVVEIQKATKRAAGLVRQILAFGREQPARKEKLDIRKVLEEVLGLLRASLPARLRIATNFADAPLVTLVDPTQLHQIVMNLVTNASHAISDRGTIELTAQPYWHRGEGGDGLDLATGEYVRLSVTDSGHGMDAATLARVFDPFFTTKPAGEGTGLGLSIVHGIVRGHGGTINVRSAVGEGTTFELYFPIVEEERTAVAARGANVLLVDDEEAILFFGKRILTRLGYRVTAHSSGNAALEALRAEPEAFDAIISDISLPGMSGVTLLVEARRVRPGIPVLLTSGYVRKQDIEAAQEADLGEPVPKPHTVEEFTWLLSRLLQERLGPPVR